MGVQAGQVGGAEPDLVDCGFADVATAAAFLGISRSKVYMLMESGELPYAKFGKCRRIPRRALHDFARACLVRSEQA
jgi:excisionase family DNA binding protein